MLCSLTRMSGAPFVAFDVTYYVEVHNAINVYLYIFLSQNNQEQI